ncbi:MAG: F0F1 ATP synthase subunit B [Anaerolineae bacterium]|nr:F0F1 ATP synthase subunit B [Anaerolineae bacterium]
MGEAFGALGINGPFLLAQIVNFLILFVAMSVLLWKPLVRRLDERRQMLEKEKADAAALAETRANIEAERERALEEARGEASKIIAEARERADALVESAAQETRQKEAEMLAEARQAAQEERNRILGEMRDQIAALAIAAAQKIIGETLDERRQHTLVESFFSGIREGRVEVLPEGAEVGPAGAPITVTSALPLTEEQQATIRGDLSARLGGEAAVSFHVDPKILGGLLVRVGDRVVDGSVSGQLERLHQSLT